MINRLFLSFVHYYLCLCRYISGDCGGKVDIFGGDKIGKGKGLPQQAEVTQGVPGRLRSRIFLTFGTTRVVGRRS
jgi:hypothetical protein